MPGFHHTWSAIWVRLPLSVKHIEVGFQLDQVGVLLSGLGVFLVLLALLNLGKFWTGLSLWRVFTALAIVLLGHVVSWTALTLWAALLGLALTIGGGFLFFKKESESEDGATLAASYLQQRVSGLLGAFFGVCLLTKYENSLIGLMFLALGTYVQFQAFPFLKSHISSSAPPVTSYLFFSQLFPAWAAFAVWYRFGMLFEAAGVSILLGWILFALVLMTIFVGLFQEGWRSSLGLWVSSAFSFAVIAQIFSGPYAGISLLLSFIFSGFLYVLLELVLQGPSHKKNFRVVAQGIAIGSALIGSGFFFLIASGGLNDWLLFFAPHPASLMTGVLIYLMQALLLWKICWMIYWNLKRPTLRWMHWVSFGFLFLFSFAFSRWVHFLWFPLISSGPVGISRLSPPVLWAIQAMLVIIAGLGTFYFCIAKPLWWTEFWRARVWLYKWIQGGFGIFWFSERLICIVERGISGCQQRLFSSFWSTKRTAVIEKSMYGLGNSLLFLNKTTSRICGESLDRLFQVASQTLQLVQNGNIQWYLFFGIGTGLVMLLHFLRFH